MFIRCYLETFISAVLLTDREGSREPPTVSSSGSLKGPRAERSPEHDLFRRYVRVFFRKCEATNHERIDLYINFFRSFLYLNVEHKFFPHTIFVFLLDQNRGLELVSSAQLLRKSAGANSRTRSSGLFRPKEAGPA